MKYAYQITSKLRNRLQAINKNSPGITILVYLTNVSMISVPIQVHQVLG